MITPYDSIEVDNRQELEKYDKTKELNRAKVFMFEDKSIADDFFACICNNQGTPRKTMHVF